MDNTVQEVLQFIEDSDVKFIRLMFCDLFGNLKNIAVMSRELPRAFEEGIPFDVSSIRGFSDCGEPDLFLHPDASTLALLPWRPQHGSVMRFFCDVTLADGTPFDASGRTVLEQAVQRAADMGYLCKFGAECEFYLFQLDEAGNPTKIPQDRAGYLDVAPLDKGENIRRDICLTLEKMGTNTVNSHHESGQGQNEIVMEPRDALTAADDLMTFKTVTRTIAALNGMFASFMPKPLPNQSGNGMHLQISLHSKKSGGNLFVNEENRHCPQAESFIAGIMNRLPDMTLFLNPLTNSYHRFGSFEVPHQIAWSQKNCYSLIQIPRVIGEAARMELRAPDPTCNPYLAYALLIHAGMEGIKHQETLCQPVDIDFLRIDEEELKNYRAVPQTLGEAIAVAEASDFIHQSLPESLLNSYLKEKRSEWRAYEKVLDKGQFEEDRYFDNT